MVDTATKLTNVSDDWETAVDSGEFDKQFAQQEKNRSVTQEPAVNVTANEDEHQCSSGIDLMKANKPIRILKRPTSQSQLSANTDVINSASNIVSSSTAANTNSSTTSTNASTSNTSSSTVPNITIIPRNSTKDSNNNSQTANPPGFVNNSNPSQSVKPPIKTYEQRELEYRLARLRIMGEEESSAKDDDDTTTVTESNSVSTDDTSKTNNSSTSSSSTLTRSNNKMSGIAQHQMPLQCHSTPGSYASNLYALNNLPPNTGTIHFTPNHNSTPTLDLGPFSSPNFPQYSRPPYSAAFSHMQPPVGPSTMSRYPLPTTTNTNHFMTSSAPFVNTPSSSSMSSSYNHSTNQHPAMATNNWYHYPPQQTPYGTQQYGHPQ